MGAAEGGKGDIIWVAREFCGEEMNYGEWPYCVCFGLYGRSGTVWRLLMGWSLYFNQVKDAFIQPLFSGLRVVSWLFTFAWFHWLYPILLMLFLCSLLSSFEDSLFTSIILLIGAYQYTLYLSIKKKKKKEKEKKAMKIRLCSSWKGKGYTAETSSRLLYYSETKLGLKSYGILFII